MNRLKILIVDDHDGFRKTLATFLRAQGGIELVGEAADGVEAVDKTAMFQPDLVLIDVHMPRSNGIEATRAIKNHSPQTKVIIMSVDSSDDYQRSARTIADGYIAKSSMKAPLLSLIADEKMRFASPNGNLAVA